MIKCINNYKNNIKLRRDKKVNYYKNIGVLII